jgi:7,8-dihydropterin-6-yl-methyl-4-(beta-D-ribofuranosyl)aminobenzene 5'-phosphate synthase
LVNIVEHGRTVTGVEKVYGIIGGTHLGPAPVEQQEATIAFLRGLDLQFLSANHCTGLPLIARLADVFDPHFFFGPAGTTFTLPSSS